MSSARRTAQRISAALAAMFTLAGLAALPVSSSADPSLGELHQQLGAEQARQHHLQSSLAGLSQLISTLERQISLVQSREADQRAQLDRDRAALAAATRALVRERAWLVVVRARLARARMLLARQLVSHYESGNPDLVEVILESGGFNDLLERITYLRSAEHQQQHIITVTRTAKAQADAATRRLARLQATDRQLTQATQVRLRALAGMDSLLHSKQAALRQAESVQRAALSASQARGGRLRSQISRIEAQQAAAAQAARQAAQQGASAGPALGASGGWAIPYAIVLCESGGQNLPPNSAGASGYYQILPSTWKLFGGTGPAAYLAGKAEQDAVAARIWRGGAGASNWVCAGIVGIH
jgi:peptidoglycan hydrolase CwlO-like protein